MTPESLRKPLSLSGIVGLHRRLEEERLSNDRVFISDWHGLHPLIPEYLGRIGASLVKGSFDFATYSWLAVETDLNEKIREVHARLDGVEYAKEEVFAGNGSTPIISTLCLWLRSIGVNSVAYVPPIFYTTAAMLHRLQFRVRKMTILHPFQDGFRLNLPDEETVLFITDPIWYAGLRWTEDQVAMLAAWQEATGSRIIVDGTFQYMQWDGSRTEWTSRLSRSKTFRLVAPTKALSIHGFRFAYLILPSHDMPPIDALYSDMHGASSTMDVLFAKQALDVLASESCNTGMIEYAKESYATLQSRGALSEFIPPECGYFLFAKPRRSLDDFLSMDDRFFDIAGLDGYARINLLAPRIVRELTRIT